VACLHASLPYVATRRSTCRRRDSGAPGLAANGSPRISRCTHVTAAVATVTLCRAFRLHSFWAFSRARAMPRRQSDPSARSCHAGSLGWLISKRRHSECPGGHSSCLETLLGPAACCRLQSVGLVPMWMHSLWTRGGQSGTTSPLHICLAAQARCGPRCMSTWT
jgi:hypothetical protein